jgi:hypothetical protein
MIYGFLQSKDLITCGILTLQGFFHFPRRSIRQQSLIYKDSLCHNNPCYSRTLEAIFGLFFLIHTYTLTSITFDLTIGLDRIFFRRL